MGKGIDLPKLAVSIILCQLPGVIGSLFTMPAIGTWYAGLAKPFFSPPNWVFGPVWITLYFLMGVSLYLVWVKGFGKKEVRGAMGVFGVQLLLNAIWSILFFGLQSPLAAFICIIVLWVMIAASIILFRRVSKPAAYLLTPYILWVSFAAVLNLAIVLLNP